MKQLGWTSTEQSEKLIEAGLSLETAYKVIVIDKGSEVKFTIDLIDESDYNTYIYCYPNDKYIPCWSLGRLIELMPKTIETKKPKNLYFPEILPANNCVAYTALNERKEMVFLKMFATGAESDATLIDNMVSMICWLLENNYIKKETK